MDKRAQKSWRTQMTNDCVKRAKQEWGAGWNNLSDQQKEGAIAREVMTIVFTQGNREPDSEIGQIATVCRDAFLKAEVWAS
jgi:hypothetical protein